MGNFLAGLKHRHTYCVGAGYAVLAWHGQALALYPHDSDVRALRRRKRLCGAAQ